jgi:hypothetical protein
MAAIRSIGDDFLTFDAEPSGFTDSEYSSSSDSESSDDDHDFSSAVEEDPSSTAVMLLVWQRSRS